MERRLIEQYEHDSDGLLQNLSATTYAIASRIAALPETIRGFGHVKEASAAKADRSRVELLQQLVSVQNDSISESVA